MAIVKKFIKDNQGIIRNKISETDCTYKIGFLNEEKYIVFSTSGSEDRKVKGKSSQVLHLNLQSAKELMEILKKEFGID